MLDRFGDVINAVRQLLAPESEQPPLQQTFGSDAESRGYGNTSIVVDPRTLAGWAYEKMKIEAGRMAAYRDYDLMDSECPEISSALDCIAEFATQADDPLAETFDIESEDQTLQAKLNDAVKALKMDSLITPTAREIAKYGGAFWELVADQDGQIVSINPLPPHTMVRNEDKFGRLQPEAFTQYDATSGKPCAHFAAWQIVHFRYMKISSRMYGTSILEPARKIYKQLSLMEDGLVVGRLYRSHVRFAFSVPVEGMTGDAILEYIDKLKDKFRKKKRLNPENGKVENFDSPMTAEEDIWLPQKEKVGTDVKVLQGAGNLGQLGDVEYFQNKIFAAVKVPKAILGFERDVNAKATLTSQDVNFARQLRRTQQVCASGVRETLVRWMMTNDGDIADPNTWTPVFPAVSTTDEQLQWQTELMKAQVAEIYMVNLQVIDDDYIYKKILDLTDEEIAAMKLKIAKMKADAQAHELEVAKVGSTLIPTPPNKLAPAGAATKQEAAIIRRVRTLLNQDLKVAIRADEVKLAKLIAETRKTLKELRSVELDDEPVGVGR